MDLTKLSCVYAFVFNLVCVHLHNLVCEAVLEPIKQKQCGPGGDIHTFIIFRSPTQNISETSCPLQTHPTLFFRKNLARITLKKGVIS